MGVIKQDYSEVQSRFEKASSERNKLDQILRGLNDEVEHQDEVISKLNKEKKYMNESMNKYNDELASHQDKFGHLNEVKAKLEKTLDQMDHAVDNEKKQKGNVEMIEGGK